MTLAVTAPPSTFAEIAANPTSASVNAERASDENEAALDAKSTRAQAAAANAMAAWPAPCRRAPKAKGTERAGERKTLCNART